MATGILRIVSGAPCSGKSEFVRKNAKKGDLIISFDDIAEALGFPDRTRPPGIRGIVKAARVAMIEHLMEARSPFNSDIWIIDTDPVDSAFERYRKYRGKVEFIELNPGMQECRRRAQSDNRPDWTYPVINQWYSRVDRERDENGTTPVATVTVKEPVSLIHTPMRRSHRRRQWNPDRD
jgi:predicted kinase